MFNTVNAKLWIILILLVLMYEKKTFDASLMSADEKDLWNKSLELYTLPDKDLVRLRRWIIMRENLVKQKYQA